MEPAAPSFPPPSFDPPSPTVSVVVDTPPRRRRTGLIVGVGAVVVAALALGGFVLARGDGDPTFSLAEAGAAAAEQDQLAFTLEMSSLGTELTLDAQLDTTAELMHMTLDVGGEALGIDASVEVVADLGDEVLYMGSDFFEQLGAPVDTPWIRVDRGAAEAAGEDTTFFDAISITNPLDATAIFDTADTVVDRGEEEIDGETVRHYEVTVRIADLLEIDDSFQQMADDFGAELPDTITYDVFVTEANTIRRMSHDIDLDVGKVKVDVTFHDVDQPLSIQVPDPADVTDVLDLF